MLKNKSLIITSKDDAHSDFMIHKSNSLGFGDRVVRLNTEDFNDNCIVSFRDGDFSVYIKDSGRELNSGEIMSVWFRRPQEIVTHHDDFGVSEYMKIQATAFLRGLYFCCHDSSLWINDLTALHRSRIKLQQIKNAINVGFDVPRTLVSNSPDKLIEFFDEFKMVCTKSLDEPNFMSDGVLYPMFTRVLADRDELVNNIDSLSMCPVLFQEYIEKKSDIRVVVLGSDIFAVEIFSQENELSIHDFRGVSPTLLKHSVHELPKRILKKIRAFVEQQGLYYSAMDFVLSKDGKYYFLENNSNGQWLWLESMAGIDISGAFLRSLFG